MESTLQKPALVAGKTAPKAIIIVYWIVTALFCMQATPAGADRGKASVGR